MLYGLVSTSKNRCQTLLLRRTAFCGLVLISGFCTCFYARPIQAVYCGWISSHPGIKAGALLTGLETRPEVILLTYGQAYSGPWDDSTFYQARGCRAHSGQCILCCRGTQLYRTDPGCWKHSCSAEFQGCSQ